MSCKQCVYCPKCKDIPADGGGCNDFRDRELFVELPFCVNQIIFFIKHATKQVPVVIDGEPCFKLVDDTKVESTVFRGDILSEYIEPVAPGQVKTVKKYFATREEAEKALAEMKKKK